MHITLTPDCNEIKIVIPEKKKDYDYIEKNNVSVFLYGYPFSSPDNSWISAEKIINLYSCNKFDFVDEIEGVYTIVIIDRTNGKYYIIVDRYGVYSLFYLKTDNFILISDIISEITPHLPSIKLNHKSIIEYLTFGFKLGNKTHIDDIYEFKEARIYEINNNLDITEKIYWHFISVDEKVKITNENYRSTFNNHVMNAFGLEENVSLPLTGGLDTRSILSACLSRKTKLHCYTHGTKKTRDAKIARKICGYFGIKHDFYELDEEWINQIPSILEENVEIFNGLVPALTYLHVRESYIKEENKGDLLLNGAMGNEIWRCPLGKSVNRANNIDDVSRIITELFIPRNRAVLEVYNYSDEVINLIKKSIKDDLVALKEHEDPISLSEYFQYRNKCSNWASSTIKYTGKFFKVFVPLINKTLFIQIPIQDWREKTEGSMQKYIIRKNNLYLANILLATGKAVNKNLRLMVILNGYINRFPILLDRIIKRLIGFNIFRVEDFTDYSVWLRKYHKNFLLKVLNHEDMVSNEIFKKNELEKVVNLFLKSDNSLTEFIVRLVSLELWLKKKIFVREKSHLAEL